jgi:hypothetical protein
MAAQIGLEGRNAVRRVGQSRAENRDVALSPRQLVSWMTTEPDRLRDGWNLDRHATTNTGQRPGLRPGGSSVARRVRMGVERLSRPKSCYSAD